MNYFKFHIGDHTRATAHLTPLEDIAYRRMQERYFSSERALPESLDVLCRLIRMTSESERSAVAAVAAEFFTCKAGHLHNSQWEADLKTQQGFSKKQSANVSNRWEREKTDTTVLPENNSGIEVVIPPLPITHIPLPIEQGKSIGSGEKAGFQLSGSPAAGKAQRYRQITEDAVGSFNEILAKPTGKLPAVHLVNAVREANVKRCIDTARAFCEKNFHSPIITRQFWDDYFSECASDDFLSGKTPPGKDHANWTPDFEFLTRPATMTKLFDKAMSA